MEFSVCNFSDDVMWPFCLIELRPFCLFELWHSLILNLGLMSSNLNTTRERVFHYLLLKISYIRWCMLLIQQLSLPKICAKNKSFKIRHARCLSLLIKTQRIHVSKIFCGLGKKFIFKLKKKQQKNISVSDLIYLNCLDWPFLSIDLFLSIM